MNLGNFTIKAAEAFQQAQQIAFNAKNPNIETEHILKALLEQEDSAVEYLLKKNNVTLNIVQNKLDELINKLPNTNGNPAQSISRDGNNVVLRAGAALKQFGDEFITPEHLLLAIVQGNEAAAKLLKDAGLTEKGLIAAVIELRKGDTVTSQTQTQEFNSLNKYAKNNKNDLSFAKFRCRDHSRIFEVYHIRFLQMPCNRCIYNEIHNPYTP